MSPLRKRDVEALWQRYDTDPVGALAEALRRVLDTDEADWAALVKSAGFTCARRVLLQGREQSALDELARELNELRGLSPAR
ncbi:MAG: hypothetical protein RI900_2158 [Actinomycetota bacterium]